ncbi:hypothetical protein CgunFtcFv8_006066 [Champsocephalus gunnari]|uniref:Uncharacterized protein n=1 Tax=Champsocephalus gunnari TaxID=52237 RepID=A0AAN8BXE8_CHAGU|nr:hypothetical protein CgunFtcFv8_006066 [Champsocephalus gunnari]
MDCDGLFYSVSPSPVKLRFIFVVLWLFSPPAAGQPQRVKKSLQSLFSLLSKTPRQQRHTLQSRYFQTPDPKEETADKGVSSRSNVIPVVVFSCLLVFLLTK